MAVNYNFDDAFIEYYFLKCDLIKNIQDSEGDEASLLYKHYIECLKLHTEKINTQNKFTSYIKQNYNTNIRSNKKRVNNTYLLRT